MAVEIQPPTAWLESPGGQQTPICGTCVLGRATASTLALSGDRVSRRHAMVHAQGEDEFWLVDLGSANGTYLNGRRVSQPCRLTDRDQITIADQAIIFRNPQTQRKTSDQTRTEKTIQEIKSVNCWLLVADIEGSTQFTQRLPADEAPRVTGRWLAECKQVIDDNNGAINKFLGDGFFAYWFDREGTVNAVGTALAVLKQQQAKAHPRFRIVLHYGKVFVGGAASLGEESLLGNEVNFIFRMEKLAGSLGVSCLMSEAAQERMKSLYPPQDESRHSLTGFEGNFSFFRF
jgi:adenylate cyclase